MKGIAFILAVVAGFFMFQPGFAVPQRNACSSTRCEMQSMCGSKKHCKNKRSKDGCASNGCNPFMACWCGNFFMIEKPFSSTVPITELGFDFLTRDDKKTFGVAFECWHPPEMV
jgi:hypothetical protein